MAASSVRLPRPERLRSMDASCESARSVYQTFIYRCVCRWRGFRRRFDFAALDFREAGAHSGPLEVGETVDFIVGGVGVQPCAACR